jgi:bifunctional non-homologous end joining protein LigD
VRSYGFEGLIAKRRDSLYEPGKRSGAWRKMRIHRGQEFVIGGYTPSARSFDALIFGYYEGDRLMYVARTRNGFTPRSRLDLVERLRELETATCPFSNLPETKSGRWGQPHGGEDGAVPLGQPVLVGNSVHEWTPDNRGIRAVALRDDRTRDVRGA